MTTVALGEVVDFYSGGTPSKGNPDFWNGDVPWFSAKDMKQPRLPDSVDHVTEAAFRSTSLRKLPAGTVAMVVRGMILAHTVPIAVLDVESSINQDLKALLPRREIDSSFLAAVLRAQHDAILAQVTTAAHGTKKLESRVLENIRIPLPPLAEQRRLASILDEGSRLVSLRRRQLALLDELSAANAARLFACVTRKDRLADVARRVTVGHVGPTSEHVVERGVPLIRTQNIRNGAIQDSSLVLQISDDFAARLAKSRLRTGDVLISRHVVDEIRAAILPTELDGANCANILVVSPGSELRGPVLLHFLRTQRAQRALLGRRVGSAQSVVNTKVLKELIVPVPDRSAQEQFCSAQATLDLQRTRQTRALTAAEMLVAALQHEVFGQHP